jgi:hypothetical protein
VIDGVGSVVAAFAGSFGPSGVYFPALGAVGAFGNRTINENRVQVGFSYKFDTAAPAPVVAKY